MGYHGHAEILYGILLNNKEDEKIEDSEEICDLLDSLHLSVAYTGDSRIGMNMCAIGGAKQSPHPYYYTKVDVDLSPEEKADIESRIKQFCEKVNILFRECAWYMTGSIV